MQTKNRHLLRTAVAGAVAFVAGAVNAYAATLAEANSAYRSNRNAEAETLYAGIAADPAAPANDRAEAMRELARFDWLFRGETDAAASALAQTQAAADRCETLIIALRIFSEADQPQIALDDAARAPGQCTLAAAERMNVALARAHVAQARLAPAGREAHLATAAQALGTIAPIARARPDVASTWLATALTRGDAPAAMQAWRDFFWLTDTDVPNALSMYAGRVGAVFQAGLAPTASEADRIALVDMLIRAGFSDDAKYLAGAVSDAPGWRRARAYFTYRAAHRAIALRTNRALARGEQVTDHEAAMNAATTQLIQDAGLTGDPDAAVAEAYGLFGTDPGTTGGYPSLHLGHMTQDDHMQVAQYGRQGEVRFVVVDNMLDNGFQSWLWDGRGQVGGWSADGNLIAQVRSAYTTGPLNDLRRSSPGPDRDQFLADLERRSADERAALARDRVGEIHATGDRLNLQALEQIRARVGDDDEAFIAEYWRAINQFSIEAHEGRHALDTLEFPDMSGPELEYRAKLSQIAFADYPRLAFVSITQGSHDGTQHGVADLRLLGEVRTWMRRHRREIVGFDRSQPTLTQIDRLTDAQFVEIARSLDPWAREARRQR